MGVDCRWDDSYCIGDRDIDAQHKKMFEILNAITESMTEEDIKSYILVLSKHAREHFRSEEALMKRVNYPHIENHKERHTELITTLSEKCLDDFKGQFAIEKFKAFIYHWVRDHIVNVDSALFEYVKQQNGYTPPDEVKEEKEEDDGFSFEL